MEEHGIISAAMKFWDATFPGCCNCKSEKGGGSLCLVESSWEGVADRLPKSSSLLLPGTTKKIPQSWVFQPVSAEACLVFLFSTSSYSLILIYFLLFVFKVLCKRILVLRNDALFVTIPSQQVENIRSSMPTRQQPISYFVVNVFVPASNLIS